MEQRFEKKKKKEVLKQDKGFEKHQGNTVKKIIKKLIMNWALDLQASNLGIRKIHLHSKADSKNSVNSAGKELTITHGPINYNGSPEKSPEEKKFVAEREEKVANPSDNNVKFKFTISQSVEETIRHVFSVGVSAGISAGAMTPYGGGALGLGFNFGFERGLEKKDIQTIERTAEREVKGRHEQTCRVQLWVQPLVDRCTLDIVFEGDVKIQFKRKVQYQAGKLTENKKGEKQLFIPIYEIFQQLQSAGKLPDGMDFRIEQEKVICTVTGEHRSYAYSAETVIEREVSLDGDKATPAAPLPAESTSKKAKEPAIGQLYTYEPKVRAVGTEIKSSTQGLKSFDSEKFTALLKPANLPSTVKKSTATQYALVHGDRPLPDAALNRPVSVNHLYEAIGTAITISADNKDDSQQVHQPKKNLLKKSIQTALTSGYQFIIKHVSATECEILLKQSPDRPRKTATTLEELKKIFSDSLRSHHLDTKIQVNDLCRDDFDGINLTGAEEALIKAVKLLQKAGGKHFPLNPLTFFGNPEKEAAPSEQLPQAENEISCKIQ